MDAFRQQRTGERARRMAISQLACMGRHTVTGLLCTSGRQFLDWSGDYRLFSRDRWEVEKLFVPITAGLLEFLPPGAPLVVGMDDTILEKTGRKIPGTGYRRDPLSPPFHVNFIWGQRFLQLSGMLPATGVPGDARAIPLRFQHVPPVAKPKKSASDEEKKAYRQAQKLNNLSSQGAKLLKDVRAELDQQHGAMDRRFVAVVDGGYTNQEILKNLPERTTLIGRIRKDAKLFYPPEAADQPARGAKRQYGRSAPTPLELQQDESIPWQTVTAFGAGKLHSFRIKTTGPVLWKTAGSGIPLRLVVIAPLGYRPRKDSKMLYRRPAYLICTDLDLPLAELIQYYIWRWGVEVNHHDEKQVIGVGDAQVRSPQSVDHQPAFAVASYAILLLAGTRAFGADVNRHCLPPPKWRSRHLPGRVSTEELIRQLRSEVWANGIRRMCVNSEPFVTDEESDAKASDYQLPAASTLLYAGIS